MVLNRFLDINFFFWSLLVAKSWKCSKYYSSNVNIIYFHPHVNFFQFLKSFYFFPPALILDVKCKAIIRFEWRKLLVLQKADRGYLMFASFDRKLTVWLGDLWKIIYWKIIRLASESLLRRRAVEMKTTIFSNAHTRK